MAYIDVYHYKCEFILQFIEDSDLGIEHLCDINFGNQHILNEAIKLGFDPNKWELKNPYSKILVEGNRYDGSPYIDLT